MRGTVGLPTLAATLAAFLGSCFEPPLDSGQSVETEGDWTIVRSTKPLISDTLDALETLRIGSLTGAPEYTFGNVIALAVDEAGNVSVFDQSEGIRVYDRSGTFLRSLAGLGQGPGEVEFVTSMHASAPGDLVLFDLGNSRVARYKGERLDQLIPLRRLVRPSYQEDAILIHEGSEIWVGFNPLLDSEGVVGFPRPIFGRVSEAGSVVDTVYAPPRLLNDCPTLTERDYRRGFWDDSREPYVPKVKWALGPDGTLVFGCSHEYEFEILQTSGRKVRAVKPYSPVEITPEEKDFLAQYAGMGQLPDHKPAYVRLIAPGDGRVWVWPSGPSARVPLPDETVQMTGVTHTWVTGSSGAFDVFSTEGEWLAVVRMPHNLAYSGFPTEPSVVIRGDTIWGVVRDDVDVQYVSRFEVRGLSQAPDGD